MKLEVAGPAPPGNRPESQAATKPLDTPSLPLADIASACESFVVLVYTPTGKYRRRVYLSLHSATAAVRRAQDKGQPVRMVLARLTPVAADLDLGGQWSA